MKHLLILIIKIYQRTLSPDHGLFRSKWPYGFCRYYPSCSEYALESLKAHGTLRGGYISIKRIIRCNPFSQPGVDQVPKL